MTRATKRQRAFPIQVWKGAVATLAKQRQGLLRQIEAPFRD